MSRMQDTAYSKSKNSFRQAEETQRAHTRLEKVVGDNLRRIEGSGNLGGYKKGRRMSRMVEKLLDCRGRLKSDTSQAKSIRSKAEAI